VASVLAFSVTPEGEVYQAVVSGRDEVYVARFAKDGTYRSRIRLSPAVEPHQLAVFKDGSALVSGFEWTTADTNGPTGPFTGIYGSSGNLLRRLKLKEDELAQEKKPKGYDPRSTVSLASAFLGSDDYVYYVRRTESPTIYVLSPGGEIVRSIRVRSPGKRFEPETIKVAGGRIAIEFIRDDPKNNRDEMLLEVVDAQTGNPLGAYRTPQQIGSAFACFTLDEFTFLTAKDGKVSLIKAAPR
jgi:hypothetical protein